MALAVERRGKPTADAAGLETDAFRLRSYQTEMVEQSMNENVIVAMDTGSGKTHIALARTDAELARCEPHKLVWFLTPTVALLEQQHKVFQSNLPGYCIQAISGKDNVDHWTDQSTWDAVLENVRIVLSTHQVLLDALTHGFVKMGKLALIIFDEAHHCVQNHPANLILANFYLPVARNGGRKHLPGILGLSASPVMKAAASTDALRQIEENMLATTKTPKEHRSELLRFVHKPELLNVDYTMSAPASSPLLAALEAKYLNYDFETDPYIIELLAKKSQGNDVEMKLRKVLMSKKTYCYQELRKLLSRSKAMAEELGTSVSEWYVSQCLASFKDLLQTSDSLYLPWADQERQHLLRILQDLPVPKAPEAPFTDPSDLSAKVEALVDVLVHVSEANADSTGIVFVEQRVWVTALAEILSTHPGTKGKFNIGTFVGFSESSKRKANIANLTEPKNQQDTLDKFRAGDINLILATTVLEEGIDVSSCSLVICFECPKNLKSFVQRRGRARKQESKYYIFRPPDGRWPESWEALETEMKKAYLNDLRKVKQAEEREQVNEPGERYYRVESTSALLTLGNAVQHLQHFCATLGSSEFIDLRPQYQFEEVEGGKISAKVTLPLSVDAAVRTTSSLRSWETERMARKDASFEAYRALHAAGLVNDNLLPARQEADELAAEFQSADRAPALTQASSTLDPWVSVAERQQQRPYEYHRTLLQLDGAGGEPLYMMLLTPIELPEAPAITLYWNETKRFSVRSQRLLHVTLSDAELSLMRATTQILLASAFERRMSNGRDDFLWLLTPCDANGQSWSNSKLEEWKISTSGTQSATDLLSKGFNKVSGWGELLVEGDQRKYYPQDVKTYCPEPHILATRVPKRRDFLHPVPDNNHINDAYVTPVELPLAKCVVANLPRLYATFALLVPSIMHKFETLLLADTLRTTLLAPLKLAKQHLPLIITAVTASITNEADNYQRLEFFGDCILKFIASVHLMADRPTWPESFLTGKKSKIVSNGFATRATLTIGLDQFILTKRFTGAKWAPRYTADILDSRFIEEKRTVSSKLLADVVESLIGLSYIVGGFPKAHTCIQTLLPLEPWTPLPTAHTILFDAAPADLHNNLTTLESLIAYTFHKKSLLIEAITHGSYEATNATRSYERLEFLGDAVLDYIVSRRLFAHTPALSHQKMHGIRSAVANAAFLAFRMFETTVQETVMNTADGRMRREQRYFWLWQFMRAGADVKSDSGVHQRKHIESSEETLRALREDGRFPWHLLALNDAPKFLSDIVESVIGGIYVDSHGDVAACEGFVERLGILQCLERILRDGVDCLHPKERLGHLAADRGVKYVRVDPTEHGVPLTDGGITIGNRDADGKAVYSVQVLVGGTKVGGVVEGVKRLNAETRAAFEAVRVLEGGWKGDVEMRGGSQSSSGEDVFWEAGPA